MLPSVHTSCTLNVVFLCNAKMLLGVKFHDVWCDWTWSPSYYSNKTVLVRVSAFVGFIGNTWQRESKMTSHINEESTSKYASTNVSRVSRFPQLTALFYGDPGYCSNPFATALQKYASEIPDTDVIVWLDAKARGQQQYVLLALCYAVNMTVVVLHS